MLEPRHGAPLISSLWQTNGHALLVVVNYSDHPVEACVEPGPLADRGQQFQDRSRSIKPQSRSADQLRREGIPVHLPAWGVQVWRVMPER